MRFTCVAIGRKRLFQKSKWQTRDQYYYSELLNLGYHAAENGYDRGSAVHEIFRAVDADYPNLNYGFCCARNHAYGLTRKGDREYFLSQQ